MLCVNRPLNCYPTEWSPGANCPTGSGLQRMCKVSAWNDFKHTHQYNGFLNMDKFVCASSKRPYFVKSCQLQTHKITNSSQIIVELFQKNSNTETSSF